MNTDLKLLIAILAGLILFSKSSLATSQTPDYLIYKKDTLTISSNPLEQYLNSNPFAREILESKLGGGSNSTDCWRGYIAYWTLRNDSLFLVDLRHCFYDDVSVKYIIPRLFNENTKNKHQFAFWFAGILVSKQGDLVQYVHSGYRSIFEKEVIYSFSNGRFKGLKELNNPKVKSDFTDVEDVQQFISCRIDWSNIEPETDSIKITTSFDVDTFGNISNVQITESSIESLEKEIIHIVESIPNWVVYYRGGFARTQSLLFRLVCVRSKEN